MPAHWLTGDEYRVLVEQSPLLIWRAGTDALCNYFNERWLSFRGRTLAQELGNGWTEGVHPQDFQRCLDHYLTNFAAQRIFEMEYRLQRADGTYRWIFDRGVPFCDADGVFAGYIGSCADVTERVEAEAALTAARMAEIEHLQRLVPMCTWCKKIRDDAGYWQQVEVYIGHHAKADVTHGICPSCSAEHFGFVDP